MIIGSTDWLRLLAKQEGRFLLLELSTPAGVLKREMVTLREPNGELAHLRDEIGRKFYPELPRETLNDFLQASLVRQDGYDANHNLIYRPTSDGLERGRDA
jgi:hypothetical protein